MMYYVYFAKPNNDHPRVFKIGVTQNIEKRFSQIKSVESYTKINLLSYIEVEAKHEALFLEKFLHKFLLGYKVKGKKDWYQYDSPYVLALVDTIFTFWKTSPDLLRQHLDRCPYIWSKHLKVKIEDKS